MVERKEKQMHVMLHKLMGKLARRLQLVLWIEFPSLQFDGNWRCSYLLI